MGNQVHEIARLLAGTGLLDNGDDVAARKSEIAAGKVVVDVSGSDETKGVVEVRCGEKDAAVEACVDDVLGLGDVERRIAERGQLGAGGKTRVCHAESFRLKRDSGVAQAESGGQPAQPRICVRPADDYETLRACSLEGAKMALDESHIAKLEQGLVGKGPKAVRGAAG